MRVRSPVHLVFVAFLTFLAAASAARGAESRDPLPGDFSKPLPQVLTFSVKGGENGQRIRIWVNRWGGPLLMDGKEAKEFRLSVVRKPVFVVNERWVDGPTLRFAADEWRKMAVLEFDAAPESMAGQADRESDIVLKIEAIDTQTFPPSREVRLPLQLDRAIAPGKAAVQAYPVKPDAPDKFPMERAAEYCALDVEAINEYDRIVVFFTPRRDVNEDYREEFRYRLKDGAGKKISGGDWTKPAEGEQPSGPILTAPESPGRLVINHVLSLIPREPGTFVLETIRLKRTAGVGLFGQGQGYAEAGEWQEEGRFEVREGRIHFQGFIAEPVKNHPMPRKAGGVARWSGVSNIERLEVNHEKATVELELSAGYTPATKDRDGTLKPVNKEWTGRTRLSLSYPQEIRLGRAEVLRDARGKVAGKKNVAEIEVEWSVKGEARYTPNLLPPTPIRQAPPSREPFERKDGIKLLERMYWPHTIGLDHWLPEHGKRSVFAIKEVSTSEVFGDPPRTLAGHFRDPETIWVLPVRLVHSDDVKVYAYAVYRSMPGQYEGPPPVPPPDSGGAGHPTGERDAEISTTDLLPPPSIPDVLDPARDSKVAALIREWISMARPPENAVEGNNVRYSGKGNIVGTVVGGVIESRHETGEVDPVFLWTNRRSLDSVDHCTMEEYVVARSRDESIGHCAGRYGAVRKLKGLKLAEAKSLITAKGFTYTLAPGSPAKTLELEGRVEKQEPGPEQYLKKGQAVKLTIHAPHVPAGIALVDFTGKALGEARKWLEDNKLKAVFKPGSPAPAAALSGAVEKQEPAPGTTVKKGSKVTLTIHSKYVDLRPVPELAGLSLADARQALERAGLVPTPSLLGAAPTAGQAGRVAAQRPGPGTPVAQGSSVEIDIYGEYAPPRAGVPDVRGMTLSEAQHALRNAGFGLEPVLLGAAPSAQQAQKVNAQSPAPGTTAAPGTTVRVDVWGEYASRPVYRPRIFRHDLTGNYEKGAIRVTLENGRFIGRNYGSHLDTESYRRKGYSRGIVLFEVSIQPDIEETARSRQIPGTWGGAVAYPGKVLTEINNRATYVNGYVYALGCIRDDMRYRLIIRLGRMENGRIRSGGDYYHVSRSLSEAEVERIQ
jgi:beta-lactam-binding protein with PASTA domain